MSNQSWDKNSEVFEAFVRSEIAVIRQELNTAISTLSGKTSLEAQKGAALKEAVAVMLIEINRRLDHLNNAAQIRIEQQESDRKLYVQQGEFREAMAAINGRLIANEKELKDKAALAVMTALETKVETVRLQAERAEGAKQGKQWVSVVAASVLTMILFALFRKILGW